MELKTFTLNKRVNLNYLLYLPKSYTGAKKWPLILFLHGAGERGNYGFSEKIWGYGLHKVLHKDDDFPFIVITPQCPENEIWEMQFHELMDLLKFIEGDYSVDQECEYLTGMSLGAYGVWNYAMLNPSRFAAIVPVCGGATFPMKVTLLKDLPIWAFHGRLDKSIPFEESEQLVNALKAINGNIRF
ncbi:MAG TPA: alpha/beta hydrolase-fold protein, partial [Bacillota bacterium]|nr:alpha/beta hydrolase-fold protein [Bacillota bacterium]